MTRELSRFALLLLGPCLLIGCRTIGAVAGAAAGASVGTISSNPLIGYSVAVGVNAGIDDLEDYIARVRQNAEQDAIVQAVGTMNVGDMRYWKIVHTIPMFDNEHGEMRVTRMITNPLTECKEVLFTVDKGNVPQAIYTTSACQDTQGWKWAAAEPAIERWGYLQHISH